MKKNYQINTAGVTDRVKQTLDSKSVTIYDWMFDTNLHQADLLVYAAMFDILRHFPLTPQRIQMKDIAERINYTVQSVFGSIEVLQRSNLIFSQGERLNRVYSLFPFDTLDLK